MIIFNYAILQAFLAVLVVDAVGNLELPLSMRLPKVQYGNPYLAGVKPTSKFYENSVADLLDDREAEKRQMLKDIKDRDLWITPLKTIDFPGSSDMKVDPKSKRVKENWEVRDQSFMVPYNSKDLIAISGFKYCKMYDGSVFRSDVPLYAYLYPSVTPDKLEAKTIDQLGVANFIKFIDQVAKAVHKDLKNHRDKHYTRTTNDSIDRLSCMYAVDGRNHYLRYAQKPLLQHVNPQTYFPTISFGPQDYSGYFWGLSADGFYKQKDGPKHVKIKRVTVDEEGNESVDYLTSDPKDFATPSSKKLKHYKMAYTILAHENIVAMEACIKALTSPVSVVMIHIDGKHTEFRQQVIQLIEDKGWTENVFVTKNSHVGRWGGHGLVYGQLTAFFELIKRCTFEYVITMSAYNAPLYYPEDMYEHIKKKHNDKILFMFLSKHPEWALSMRHRLFNEPVLQSLDYHSMHGDDPEIKIRWMKNVTPLGYQFYAVSQWQTLTYAYVKALFHDPNAATMLIPLEFGFLMDETYFAIYTQWSPRFYHRIKIFPTCCYYLDVGNQNAAKFKDNWKDFAFVTQGCANAGIMTIRKWDPLVAPKLGRELEKIRKRNHKSFLKRMSMKIKAFWQKVKDSPRKFKEFWKKLFSKNNSNK